MTRQPPDSLIKTALGSCGAALVALVLSACSSSPFSFLGNPASEAVVYALGPRDGHTSPLNASLTAACPALVFGSDGFKLSSAHELAVKSVYDAVKDNKKARLLIAGYAPPNLPHDHARSLSERRAQAVRQRFIELGMEPVGIQTVGFGNDFSPTGPSSGVVVIYRQ
ncbi:MAG: OmpA family protein [Prosthecobacter sp.]